MKNISGKELWAREGSIIFRVQLTITQYLLRSIGEKPASASIELPIEKHNLTHFDRQSCTHHRPLDYRHRIAPGPAKIHHRSILQGYKWWSSPNVRPWAENTFISYILSGSIPNDVADDESILNSPLTALCIPPKSRAHLLFT